METESGQMLLVIAKSRTYFEFSRSAMNPGTHQLILQALPATILPVEDEPAVREITPNA
jgi:hypothetical protein